MEQASAPAGLTLGSAAGPALFVGTARIKGVSRSAGRAPVYDLTIEGAHEFFANGILVHNCDELAAWKRLQEAWDMLQFGLRLGENPQAVVTTTPKPLPLIYELVRDPLSRVVTGSTYENKANLAGTFLRKILAYEGTELGAQEIHAELIDLDTRAILKAAWWRRWGMFDHSGQPVYPHAPLLAFASVDCAYTEKEENDETAVTVWVVYRDEYGRERVLLRYGWKDRLEFHALVERLKQTCQQFGLTRVVVEAKASGLSVIQEMRRQTDVVVHPWVPQGDKLARAHAIAPILKAGLVSAGCSMVEGEPTFRPWAQMVIDECKLFPFGPHDDVPDTVSMALAFIRSQGFELFERDAPSPPPASATGRGARLY